MTAEPICSERITFKSDAPRFRESRLKKFAVGVFTGLFQCAAITILAVGVYWVVSRNLYQSVQVDGPSMDPTLRNAEKYILNRWVYHVRDPRPNEIVVLKDPQDSVYEVKRVIATAGQSVYIKKGRVYVDGKLLDEAYLEPLTKTYAPEKNGDEFVCCGRNQYFVLGDNRGVSRDSRYFGPVRRENIMGKLVL